MLPRFFAPDAATAGEGAFELPRDEAHHATRVMRLAAGDEIAVFDGAGHEWRARIARVERERVRVALVEPLAPASEPRVQIVLVHAVLKGDHMDAVVRDATMIGVSAIQPIVTAHTVARPRGASAEKLRERWLRVAVASAKQCRRAVVPAISFPISLAAISPPAVDRSREARFVLVEPSAGVTSRPVADAAGPPPQIATVAVGPEGGWSQEEIGFFSGAGFEPVTLGRLTLRADAAALAAISAFRALWRE